VNGCLEALGVEKQDESLEVLGQTVENEKSGMVRGHAENRTLAVAVGSAVDCTV
jgi:hypothetical protein